MSDLLELAKQKFREAFSREPEVAVFAPGRVNLIGEHVDYNDGYVLPFALPYRTVMVGCKSTAAESRVTTASMPTDNLATFVINRELCKGSPEWTNYIKGTIFQYLDDLPEGASFDAAIASNVPLGSGLSSSAALEVCVATFMEKLFNITSVSSVSKALRCQKAEHTFAGMPCGIMDQYISAMGAAGSLLLIDCRKNESELIPFGGADAAERYKLVVTNSNVKHKLSDSEYPIRVSQCKEAVAGIQRKFPDITALRDVTMEMLTASASEMSEIAFKRARHCITENMRTLSAVSSLKSGGISTVGRLMTESHFSLRDDYEVSCPELDTLVDIALSCTGVLGSRMTGGGFGGCIISLVEVGHVEDLITLFEDLYQQRTGKVCVSYVVVPSAGANEC